MSFVEKILPYERELFLWLNGYHTPYWDVFMWIYGSKLIWLPLIVIALIIFTYKIKWKEAVLILICAVLIGILCDYVSAQLIKPFFERLRPTYHPDFKQFVDTVNGYRGGRYGFISNHAANGFGVVAFTSLLFRYKYLTITLILWATITAYSRIYLGVHFISDVVGGAIWGTFIGVIIYYVYLTSRRYILKVPEYQLKTPIYSKNRANILIAVIIATILFIAIFSVFFNIPS
ncbi:MAG: phosphatase PAP2 family protein [Prevotella sp.]|jgi:undecaprenyl-diphosphatase|nr:phosphatase PAP2 family protein [Prevotella sp.]